MNYSGSVEFDFSIYRLNKDEEEEEIVLNILGRSFHHAGKSYGDPSECYPDEYGTDLKAAVGPDGKDWRDQLTDDEMIHILECIQEEALDYD